MVPLSKSESVRIELLSQMLSRMLVVKKSLVRVQRGGQNRAGIQRKGVPVTGGCLCSAHKQGCSSDLFRSAQSCEINVMHFRINVLILVLSPH